MRSKQPANALDALTVRLKLDDVTVEAGMLSADCYSAAKCGTALRVPLLSVQLFNTAVTFADAFDATRCQLDCNAEVAASWYEASTLEERVVLQPVPISASVVWRQVKGVIDGTKNIPRRGVDSVEAVIGQAIVHVSAPFLRQLSCLLLAHAHESAADVNAQRQPWTMLIKNSTSTSLHVRQTGSPQCLHLPPQAEVAYVWGQVSKLLSLELQHGTAGAWTQLPLVPQAPGSSAAEVQAVGLKPQNGPGLDVRIQFSLRDGLVHHLEIGGSFRVASRLSQERLYFSWALDEQGLPGVWSDAVPLFAASGQSVLLPLADDRPNLHFRFALGHLGEVWDASKLLYGAVALIGGMGDRHQQYILPSTATNTTWVAIVDITGQPPMSPLSCEGPPSVVVGPVIHVHNQLDLPLTAVAYVSDGDDDLDEALSVLVSIGDESFVITPQRWLHADAAQVTSNATQIAAKSSSGLLGLRLAAKDKGLPQISQKAGEPVDAACLWQFTLKAGSSWPWTLHVASRLDLLSQLPFDVDFLLNTEDGGPARLKAGQRLYLPHIPVQWRACTDDARGANWHPFPNHADHVDAITAMLSPSLAVVIQSHRREGLLQDSAQLSFLPSLQIENQLVMPVEVTWPGRDGQSLAVAAHDCTYACPAHVLEVLRGHYPWQLACANAAAAEFTFVKSDLADHAAAQGVLRSADGLFQVAVHVSLDIESGAGRLVVSRCVIPPLHLVNLTPQPLLCKMLTLREWPKPNAIPALYEAAKAVSNAQADWPHRRPLSSSLVIVSPGLAANLPFPLLVPDSAVSVESMGHRAAPQCSLLITPLSNDNAGTGPQLVRLADVGDPVQAMPLQGPDVPMKIRHVYKDGCVMLFMGDDDEDAAQSGLPRREDRLPAWPSVKMHVKGIAISLVHAFDNGYDGTSNRLGPWRADRKEQEIVRLAFERIGAQLSPAEGAGETVLDVHLGRIVLENRLADPSATSTLAEKPQFEFVNVAECPGRHRLGRVRAAEEPTAASACTLTCTFGPEARGAIIIRSLQFMSADWRLRLEDRVLGLVAEFSEMLTDALGPLTMKKDEPRISQLGLRRGERNVRPVVVEQLCVSPLCVVLSVHADVVMFLSVDEGRLKVDELRVQRRVFSDASHMAEDLLSHYASEAVLNAGV